MEEVLVFCKSEITEKSGFLIPCLRSFMKNTTTNESGFTYIDVIIAIVILMVGILGATAALTANLLRAYESEKSIAAKQIALSTIESIFSARDIARVGSIEGWDSVGNVADGTKGVFLADWRPIRDEAGWDGVAGTADDACDVGVNCKVKDNPANTSDVIQGFERKIEITDIQDPDRPSPPHAIARRRIDVSVRYNVNQLIREQKISTIITNY